MQMHDSEHNDLTALHQVNDAIREASEAVSAHIELQLLPPFRKVFKLV